MNPNDLLQDISDRDSSGFITLKRSYSDLYRKVNYLAPYSVVQNKIYEYDIKAANISILKTYGKLKKSTLDKLDNMDKETRNVTVGKIIREDKSVKKTIAKGIKEAKRQLFESNGVQDSEILSIKNDAVFVIGRKLKTTTFGPVEFKLKNQFSIYINIEGIEFYYNKSEDDVVIKGINDSIVAEEDHQTGMLEFFRKVFKFLVYDRKQDLREYLIEFSNLYKARELPYQYYRELNTYNIYRTIYQINEYEFNLIMINDEYRDDINITYNYRRFVLPLIQKYI